MNLGKFSEGYSDSMFFRGKLRFRVGWDYSRLEWSLVCNTDDVGRVS